MIFRDFYYLCIMNIRSKPFLVFACAAAVALAGCIKMPKADGTDPGGPDGPDGPDNPSPSAEYVYPYGDEPRNVTAELTLTFASETDLTGVEAVVPPLKYNKSLLVLLTQDDCKQAAFSATWAAINGRPLSDTYYYTAAHLRGGDMPPDTYGFGKTLGSTDGTGREVRFSFSTTLSPEWEYMDAEATVKPGYTDNYYRFFMQRGLMWGDVREMLNYGVGIAFHDVLVDEGSKNLPDSIFRHYGLSQEIMLDRLAGRGCKMLAEPDGNKTYVTAAMSYDPILSIVQQSEGEKLRPFAVEGDLVKKSLERGFWQPKEIPGVIESRMAQPVKEREAVNIGVHGTDRSWSEMLLWLNNTYGKEGIDCLWMPSPEEYFEYNYLRHHAVLTPRVEGNTLHLTVDMPGGLYFYFPSLTLNLPGVDPAMCLAVEGGETVKGLSWGTYAEAVGDGKVLAVNIDCRHALAEHAEHFVELYEKNPTAANRADARYFVEMLKESDLRQALLERVK